MIHKPKYIITAYNKILNTREAITKPHEITWCLQALHAVKNVRSRKKACHKLYRIERLQPQQLFLNFKNDEL